MSKFCGDKWEEKVKWWKRWCACTKKPPRPYKRNEKKWKNCLLKKVSLEKEYFLYINQFEKGISSQLENYKYLLESISLWNDEILQSEFNWEDIQKLII